MDEEEEEEERGGCAAAAGGGRAAPAPPRSLHGALRAPPGGRRCPSRPRSLRSPGARRDWSGAGGRRGAARGGRERPPARVGPVLTPLSRVTSGRHGRAPPGRSLPLLGHLRAVRVLELLELPIARFAPFFFSPCLSQWHEKKEMFRALWSPPREGRAFCSAGCCGEPRGTFLPWRARGVSFIKPGGLRGSLCLEWSD